jgi:hypothetical protein
MPTVTVKTNASRVAAVVLSDIGLTIPGSGGSITFTNRDDIEDLQSSRDVRAFVVDAAFTTTSTLILNNGSDISQANALNYLDTCLLPPTTTLLGQLGSVNLTTDVSGILPYTNLGTGGTGAGVLFLSDDGTFKSSSGTSIAGTTHWSYMLWAGYQSDWSGNSFGFF